MMSYYSLKREERLEYGRQYREDNKDKIKEGKAKYRANRIAKSVTLVSCCKKGLNILIDCRLNNKKGLFGRALFMLLRI